MSLSSYEQTTYSVSKKVILYIFLQYLEAQVNTVKKKEVILYYPQNEITYK